MYFKSPSAKALGDLFIISDKYKKDDKKTK